MTKNKDLAKATKYYILHSRDYQGNMVLGGLFLGLIFFGLSQFNLFHGSLDRDLLVLFLWALMLGIGVLLGNSMVVDLTLKDILTGRLEYILASGIQIKDLLLTYSLQMARFSMLLPFCVFMIFVYLPRLDLNLAYLMGLFTSTGVLVFVLTLYFNMLALTQTHLKLFKYLLFAFINLAIYFLGSFSKPILSFLKAKNLSLPLCILAFNGVLILVFTAKSYFKFKELTNELVLSQRGTWS